MPTAQTPSIPSLNATEPKPSPNPTGAALRVAIVGAGMAGASCAKALVQAGCAVSVFEKSRGAGGRMATRRATWTDAMGEARTSRFDHGAPAFKAEHPEFQQAVSDAARLGALAWWAEGDGWVACPEQPAWAKQALEGTDLQVQRTVTRIHRSGGHWIIECTEVPTQPSGPFDAVVLAIPAIQAAPLVEPFRAAWADQARAVPQQATWTLMAVRTRAPAERDEVPHLAGHRRTPPTLIRPLAGPLALVIRHDAKPGRACSEPALEQWVAHATDAWSLAHLEDPAAEVEAMLRTALEGAMAGAMTGAMTGAIKAAMGPTSEPANGNAPETISWAYTTVHRWRYATVKPGGPAGDEAHTDDWASRPCLWDPGLQLGLAGDAFAGPRHRETGVQRAWLSGAALARRILSGEPGD